LTRATTGATLAGVTLTELLVAIALLSTVFAGTLAALEQGQRAYALGAARVEAQQNGRIALERLAREIRNAGAGGVGFDAISVAERERVVLHVDRDRDGRADARGEAITWRLAGTVLRRDDGGGAQPIVDGVRSLVLEYRDAAGRPTTIPGEVRTVVMTLTTEGAGGAGGLTLTTQTRLRTR
jgi:type II secretory pathway component PulJ